MTAGKTNKKHKNLEENKEKHNDSLILKDSSVLARVSTQIDTTNKLLAKINSSDLRSWWNSLDHIWQKIMTVNLGLELEWGGVKNNINKYKLNFKKLESYFEEGALFSSIKMQNEISDNLIYKIINLDALIAEKAEISDLTPLSKLKRMEILNCSHNKIINLDPLKDLFNLQEVNLAFNKITSVNPIKNLKKLRKLDLVFNNILSLKPIENLENLEELFCASNMDSDCKNELNIQLSSKWKKLRKLSAPHLIDPQNLVKYYQDLEDLFVHGLDVSFIIKLKRLKKLNILDSNVKKLDPLIELPDLKNLSCCSNKIESIEPLSYLPNLEILVCDFNQITDLNPLRKLKKLKVLRCMCNKIENLKALKDLTNLQHLDCSYNQITNLEPLINLSNLKQFICIDNPIPSVEIEMLEAALPNCEIVF